MTIVPRWEWRSFAADFGPAENHLAALSPERVEESDEVYLLSLGSDASVKLRDGLMDVKHRLATDDEGLELWKPVLKAQLPLSGDDVSFLFATLAVAAPPLERETYSTEQLAGLTSAVRAVRVHKRRTRYSIAGCMAELTEIQTDAGATRTIAIESTDPALVSAVVRRLELPARPVVCVARGLKALVGLSARRFAVIDVGTNSVKFHVGELGADGRWRKIIDRAHVTRLGEGLQESGRLAADPIARTVDAVAGMAEEARRTGAETIVAVGTAGLRIAPNAHELVDGVRARAGVGIDVISGEEEARLAYQAAIAGFGAGQGSLVVFDTGGGSSQFTFGDGERVEERFSVNVGAARLTERHGLDGVVSRGLLATVFDAIAADLRRLEGRPAPAAIVGMGGAVTNLAAVKHGLATYDPDVVHGTVLDRAEIDRQIELYRTLPAARRRRILGLQPNRAEVILAGVCIVRTVLAVLACDSLTVSDRGLRHGLLVERFSSR